MEPPPHTHTKHQKSIPSKLMFHIYRKHHSHLSTSIGKLLLGAFLFGMWSCEYPTTPKGENKQTRILQKGYVRFYRKRRNMPQRNGGIHMVEKLSLTFLTQKNCVNDATVSQWSTGKHLYLVKIWSDTITRLYLYPVTLYYTPVNTVWVENCKTNIMYQIKIKLLRSVTLSFG